MMDSVRRKRGWLSAIVAVVLCAVPACEQMATVQEPETPSAATGRIAGTVTGSAVAGVRIDLTGPVNTNTTTDDSGDYGFADLPPGNYEVTPSFEGTVFSPGQKAVDCDNNTHIGIDFSAAALPPPPPPPPPTPEGFSPTDVPQIYSWTHAGDGGAAYMSRNDEIISALYDQSGKGNHLVATTEADINPPVWLASVDLNPWGIPVVTEHGTIGVGFKIPHKSWYGSAYRFSGGAMAAPGEFYMATVMTNTRSAGVRDMFGGDENNIVRIDQRKNEILIDIDGQYGGAGKVVAGNVPRNLLVLEIWRDANNTVTVRANGNVLGSTTVAGAAEFNGFGFDGTPNSFWDDFLFELVFCDALPSASDRDKMRDYLMAKFAISAG